MKEIKTLTIDEFITALRQIKIDLQDEIKNPGKMKVFLSSDCEGNSFGTLEAENNLGSFDIERSADTYHGDVLIIYPYKEDIEMFNFKE